MKTLKNLLFFIFILTFTNNLYSQKSNYPKLIVGIVVDQMRYDYLTRYDQYYSNDGFKRLINNGSNFTYAHYNYTPTYTGPGHTSIYTGTTPYYHGIIGNDFYDRNKKEMVYCVEDNSYKPVGTNDELGKRSPKRLFATTITDQLKIATNGKAKVVCISLKDRCAILPGGHSEDQAYWFDDETGDFISSSYYMDKLPDWMKKFNNENLPDKYLSKDWTLSLPLEDYELSFPDNADYEVDVFSEGKTSFPHSFNNLKQKDKYSAFETTPYGNQILVDLAKEVIKNDKLGKNIVPDFLSISFSTPDFIGHEYGPNSVEIQDTYVKMDKQLADLLNYLDKEIGKGNYLIFLTADHAVQPIQGFLKSLKIPTGELNYRKSLDSLKAFSIRTFGSEKIIENYSNNQIYLNYKFLKKNNLIQSDVEKEFKLYLRSSFPEISQIFTRNQLETLVPERSNNNFLLNGFNRVRSGDIIFDLQPNYFINNRKHGTTHGTQYSYDTHVPMIFYGWDVPKQTVNKPVYIVDIAPTIANLIGINEPNACIGIPLITK